MKRKDELVICDFDGVLVNSPEVYTDWMKFWANETGYDLPMQYMEMETFREMFSTGYKNGKLDELYSLFGFPDAHTVPQFKPPSPINVAYIKFFQENIPDLYQDTMNCLDLLGKQYTLALLTTNFEANVKAALPEYNDVFEVKLYGDHKIDGDKVKKPDPRTIEELISNLDFTPKRIVHLGDNFAELETSVNFESDGYDGVIETYGLTKGFSPRHLLEEGKVINGKKRHFDGIFDSLSEATYHLLS